MVELNVRIENKQYINGTNVLDNIEFDLGTGEFVAIIGPSGCGKTTLLNMISGLEPCEAGSIVFDGEPFYTQMSTQIGYIFQQPRLMPWLTVEQNLMLIQPNCRPDTISELLASVGLVGKQDCYPRTLSGGMQRRVSIARAFLINPKVLLLDEPFNSLDAPTAARLRLLLIGFCQRQGCSVIFVTHDLQEAVYLADRILFLSQPPSRIVHQESVTLTRPRTESGANELIWQAALLAKYPSLLAGSVN
ncbi:MAG: ABC transporter ATP-binding protein [Paraglaciecola polaris]|uniref:ABC transporter ATP-binding protein n=1 Tax=Paraglaciecola polaris TaxID=222814 RepID=UPI00300382CE